MRKEFSLRKKKTKKKTLLSADSSWFNFQCHCHVVECRIRLQDVSVQWHHCSPLTAPNYSHQWSWQWTHETDFDFHPQRAMLFSQKFSKYILAITLLHYYSLSFFLLLWIIYLIVSAIVPLAPACHLKTASPHLPWGRHSTIVLDQDGTQT